MNLERDHDRAITIINMTKRIVKKRSVLQERRRKRRKKSKRSKRKIKSKMALPNHSYKVHD
jgi:hypothetical protein